MDSNEVIYSYNENNDIQYAGYPFTQCIDENNGVVKVGGYGKNISNSRFEGFTVPVGLYTYKYSSHIEETPNEKIEIEVMEEPKYQKLISLVSVPKGSSHSDLSKNKRKTRTKRKSKKSKKTKRSSK